MGDKVSVVNIIFSILFTRMSFRIQRVPEIRMLQVGWLMKITAIRDRGMNGRERGKLSRVKGTI